MQFTKNFENFWNMKLIWIVFQFNNFSHRKIWIAWYVRAMTHTDRHKYKYKYRTINMMHESNDTYGQVYNWWHSSAKLSFQAWHTVIIAPIASIFMIIFVKLRYRDCHLSWSKTNICIYKTSFQVRHTLMIAIHNWYHIWLLFSRYHWCFIICSSSIEFLVWSS